MIDLDVIVPVWGRPELLAGLYDSLADTTPCDWRLRLIVSPNDPAGLTDLHSVLTAMGGGGFRPGLVVHVAPWEGGTPGDYARKVNMGYLLGDAPVLFLGATDIVFQPGWWRPIARAIAEGAQVVGTNDGSNPRTMSGRHSTHTAVTRDYVDRLGTADEPGRVLHEGYWHEFVDDEFVATAKARHVYAHATDSRVEHLHPNWGKRPADASDARQPDRMAQGRRLFESRMHLWRHVRPRARRAQTIHQVSVRSRRPRVSARPDDVPEVPPGAVPPIDVTVIVATFGDARWERLAQERAVPSALREVAPDRVVQVHDPHGSLAEVRNMGADLARSEWLCFLDADDEIEPGYMAAMAAAAPVCPGFDYTCPCQDGDACHYAEPDPFSPRVPPLLVPAVRYVDGSGRPGRARVLNDGRPLHVINRAVVGTLVHRALFAEAGGFDPRWPIYEDWALWLRCETLGAPLVDVPGAVYRAHRRPGSRNAGPEARATYDAIRAEEHAARGGWDE